MPLTSDHPDPTPGRPRSAGPQTDATTPAQTTLAREQHAAADYVLDMSGQLASIASAAGLDLLAYLLDMVRIEAKIVKNRTANRGGDGRPGDTPG